MKLLIITPTYFGEDEVVGGAEEYVHSLARALSELPKFSRVAVLFFSPNKNSYQKVNKLEIYGTKSYLIGGNPSNPMPSFNSVSISDFDAIYLHQFNTWATCFYSIWAKILGKKVFLTDHNGGGVNYNRHLKIQNLIDINFHTSNISKEDSSVHIKKNVRIFGGVDTKFYLPISDVKKTKDFLFVGRLHPIKGVDTLIKASIECPVEHTLTLVLSSNSSEDMREVLNQTKDNPRIDVIFNETKNQLLEIYNEHRWICLPSKKALGRENLGLTILEGMACGLKAACSSNCGVKEMKEEYPTEDLIVVENWSEFFKENSGQSSESKSRDWILAHASWKQVALRFSENL